MAETAPWRLGADGRWVAEVGALGSLVVWMEPSGYRWSMAALGTERGGYLSAVAAKTAAVREARQQLVAGLSALVVLDAARFGEDRSERSASPGRRADHRRSGPIHVVAPGGAADQRPRSRDIRLK